MAANPNFDTILAQTINNYRRSVEDNIFNAMPLLFWLKSGNRKRTLNGGVKIVIPIMYGKNETVKSYAGYETLNVTPQEGISAAEFAWKQVSCSITVSGAEERKNNGEQQMINLLNSKMKQAEISIQDSISVMLFADGTGNSSKDLLGLAALVADTPTTGTVGNINRATYSWWRNYYTTATKTSTDYDNLLAAMRNTYNTCSKGNDHPDFIVTDVTTFGGYESLIVANQRFTDSRLGDAGFENLKFKGATITFDAACPTDGRMYFLNSKYLEWAVHSKADFKLSPFVRPQNQDARTAQILFMGNLCVSNCARNGIITAIT